MKKGSLYFWVFVICMVSIGLFLDTKEAFSGTDAKLVKIQPVGEGLIVGFYIDPPDLYVEKNTIVVWLSGVKDEDIQVVFMEGKTCKDVTAYPKQFAMDNKDCYVASSISYGETSTLQFVEPGTYRYYVATMEGKIKAKGSIIVRGH